MNRIADSQVRSPELPIENLKWDIEASKSPIANHQWIDGPMSR